MYFNLLYGQERSIIVQVYEVLSLRNLDKLHDGQSFRHKKVYKASDNDIRSVFCGHLKFIVLRRWSSRKNFDVLSKKTGVKHVFLERIRFLVVGSKKWTVIYNFSYLPQKCHCGADVWVGNSFLSLSPIDHSTLNQCYAKLAAFSKFSKKLRRLWVMTLSALLIRPVTILLIYVFIFVRRFEPCLSAEARFQHTNIIQGENWFRFTSS